MLAALRRAVPLALTASAALGCGGQPAAGGDASMSAPDAPRILTLDTNAALVHEGDPLVITAVVTDPDGIDDLIGGTLLDPTTGASYGAFATSAAEGAYSIRLDWAAIDLVRGIDVPAGGAPRTFRARFFDVAGHSADGAVDVVLACEDPDFAACGGDCVDLLTSPRHCGACDSPVPDGRICAGGQPSCAPGSESNPVACTDGCSNDGDAYIDCDDYDCCSVVQCPLGTACGL